MSALGLRVQREWFSRVGWPNAVDVKPDPSKRVAATAATPQNELGVTGLDVRGGRIYDDYNFDLQALASRMARFEEMRRSDTAIAICENIISLPLRRGNWYVSPAKGDKSKAGKDLAQRIERNFMEEMSHSWDDFLRKALLAVLYGFSPFEQVWETKRDGATGWKKFAERKRSTIDRWEFDEHGGLKGFHQLGFSSGEKRALVRKYTPIERALIFTWREEAGNPEGLGILRQAWKAYNYKAAFEQFAAIRIERQAISIPVATAPEGSEYDVNSSEVAEVLAVMNRLRTGETCGLVELNGWKYRFEWPGTADVPFETMIERQHQYILQPCLAQFVGFSQGGDKGSYGQAKDASSMFLMSLGATADWICEVINRYAIPRWVAYNESSIKHLPRLQHGPIGMRDITGLANFVRALFDRNVLVPQDMLDEALQEAGFKPLSEDSKQQMEEVRDALMAPAQPRLPLEDDTDERLQDGRQVPGVRRLAGRSGNGESSSRVRAV
jgi:hypothetical protein